MKFTLSMVLLLAKAPQDPFRDACMAETASTIGGECWREMQRATAERVQASRYLKQSQAKKRRNVSNFYELRCQVGAEAGSYPELRKQLLDSCPMGRLAEVEDVANAAEFLASDLASFISGQHLLVNGGANQ